MDLNYLKGTIETRLGRPELFTLGMEFFVLFSSIIPALTKWKYYTKVQNVNISSFFMAHFHTLELGIKAY